MPRPGRNAFAANRASLTASDLTYRPHKLREPLKHKQPALIFLLAELGGGLDLSGIRQLVAGGESGLHLRDPALCAHHGMTEPPPGKPNAVKGSIPRPDRIPWARHHRDACLEAGVAFFWSAQ